jgi:hypothetical protein
MPIDEAYKTKDLKKLLDFKAYIEPIIKEEIENIDEDDLEFGYSFEKELDKNLWDEAVEQNNYYDVKTAPLGTPRRSLSKKHICKLNRKYNCRKVRKYKIKRKNRNLLQMLYRCRQHQSYNREKR